MSGSSWEYPSVADDRVDPRAAAASNGDGGGGGAEDWKRRCRAGRPFGVGPLSFGAAPSHFPPYAGAAGSHQPPLMGVVPPPLHPTPANGGGGAEPAADGNGRPQKAADPPATTVDEGGKEFVVEQLFPPGKVANIQPLLEKCADQVFIGLEYVIEIQHNTVKRTSPWYSCLLCDTILKPKDGNSTCAEQTRLHIGSVQHKLKYLKTAAARKLEQIQVPHQSREQRSCSAKREIWTAFRKRAQIPTHPPPPPEETDAAAEIALKSTIAKTIFDRYSRERRYVSPAELYRLVQDEYERVKSLLPAADAAAAAAPIGPPTAAAGTSSSVGPSAPPRQGPQPSGAGLSVGALQVDWSKLESAVRTVTSSAAAAAAAESDDVVVVQQSSTAAVAAQGRDDAAAQDESRDVYDDLTIDELNSLFKNFKELDKDNQKNLIEYMKRLEKSNPKKVMELKRNIHGGK